MLSLHRGNKLGEMKDLQVAFEITNCGSRFTSRLCAALYKFARKYKLKYVITGSNFSTEYCREPEEWGGYPGRQSC